MSLTIRANWQGVHPKVSTQNNDDLTINFDVTQAMVGARISKGADGIIFNLD